MATAAGTSALSMKLLIDRKAQRVLFAEASKEVVDFLFSLLALPVATAVKLVGKDAIALLCPTVVSPAPGANSSLLRLAEPSFGQPKTLYRCTNTSYSNCRTYITDAKGKQCPTCHCTMTTPAQYLMSAGPDAASVQVVQGDAKGFVQGIVTYAVMDYLKVSTISSIALLNTFAVKNIVDLQEKTVQLGYNEGLATLKASLQSKTVLTDVFLRKKKAPGRA